MSAAHTAVSHRIVSRRVRRSIRWRQTSRRRLASYRDCRLRRNCDRHSSGLALAAFNSQIMANARVINRHSGNIILVVTTLMVLCIKCTLIIFLSLNYSRNIQWMCWCRCSGTRRCRRRCSVAGICHPVMYRTR